MIRKASFVLAAAAASAVSLLSSRVFASYEDVLLWKAVYSSSTISQEDKALGVAVDAAGNVYAAGYETPIEGGQSTNLRVTKYGPDGAPVWSVTMNGGGTASADAACSLAIDPEGSLLVAGAVYMTLSVSGSMDGWLAKFSPSGTEYWSRIHNGIELGYGADAFQAVAVDSSGNVYAAGYETRTDLVQGVNLLVVKYDSAGATLWTQSWDSGLSFADKALGVAVGPAGEAVVVGRSDLDSGGTKSAAVLRKYAADGTFVWGTTFGTAGLNMGRAAAVDSAGDIYLVGQIYRSTPSQGLNRWIRKYNSSGSQILWTREIDWESMGDSGGACALYGGALLVAGYSSESAAYQGNNLTLERFSAADGALRSQFSYSSGWLQDEAGEGVAAGPDGSVAVTGWETRTDLGQGVNWLVMKFKGTAETETGIEKVRVFPTPFKPSTAVGGVLKFALLPEGAALKIYTVKGVLVRCLASRSGMAFWDGRNENGEDVVPGIYVYAITAPEGRTRGKFVLVR